MSIKSIAAKLFAQKSIRKHKLGPLTHCKSKAVFAGIKDAKTTI
jgi:hypothetical protein